MSQYFNESDTKVSVTLYQNNLSKDNKYFGMVSKSCSNVDNIIAGILEKNPGLDGALLYHAISLFLYQSLDEIKNGHGIDLGPIGKLNIALSDTVNAINPDLNDIPDFELRYKASPAVKTALTHVKPGFVTFPNKEPTINEIEDSYTMKKDKTLTAGNLCKIDGRLLKLNLHSDIDSVKFIQVDDNGDALENEQPVMVDKRRISKTTATKLEFIVPENLISGAKYKIIITSTFLRTNASRKTPITGESAILTIN